MHKTLKKLTRAERSEIRHQQVENALSGTGRYRFQNNTSGELLLSKPAEDGIKKISRGGSFVGDSYFFQLMARHEVRLIETLGENMPEKLITEQPPVVTPDGKVEFIQPEKALNENKPDQKQKEVLLVEDPIGSIVVFD